MDLNINSPAYDATLLVHNETIFWADEILEHEDTSYTGTWIKALNLKWRKLS